MSTQFKRIVLKPPAGRKEFTEYMYSRSWNLWQRFEEDRQKMVPFELTYLSPDEKTAIHYVEDFVVGFPYVALEGRQAEAMARLISSSVPVFTEEEILEEVESTGGGADRKQALRRLGVVSPLEYDARFFAAFEAAFSDASPEVRAAAVGAAAYPAWPQFKPVLDRLRSEDRDPRVRAAADNVLAAFEEQGV